MPRLGRRPDECPNSIRKYRQAAGLTLEELCRRTGIPVHQMLRRYELGHRQPYLGTALAIAKELGVTVEELAKPPHESAPPRERIVAAGSTNPPSLS